jgi:hypothetical protein
MGQPVTRLCRRSSNYVSAHNRSPAAGHSAAQSQAHPRILKAWLAERAGQPGDPLFPGPSGQRLSRDAVERRIKALLRTRVRRLHVPGSQARHLSHAPALRGDELLLAGSTSPFLDNL